MRVLRFSIFTIALFTCAWPGACVVDVATYAQDLARQEARPTGQRAMPAELAKLVAQLRAQVRQTFHLNHRERDQRLNEIDDAIAAWKRAESGAGNDETLMHWLTESRRRAAPFRRIPFDSVPAFERAEEAPVHAPEAPKPHEDKPKDVPARPSLAPSLESDARAARAPSIDPAIFQAPEFTPEPSDESPTPSAAPPSRPMWTAPPSIAVPEARPPKEGPHFENAVSLTPPVTRFVEPEAGEQVESIEPTDGITTPTPRPAPHPIDAPSPALASVVSSPVATSTPLPDQINLQEYRARLAGYRRARKHVEARLVSDDDQTANDLLRLARELESLEEQRSFLAIYTNVLERGDGERSENITSLAGTRALLRDAIAKRRAELDRHHARLTARERRIERSILSTIEERLAVD